MPRINLLPWREAERKERKLAFLIALATAAIAALVVAFGVRLVYTGLIGAQVRRNELLQAQIQVLNHQIGEINSLEKTKRKFLARMRIIEQLQRSRPQIVHIFDQIVRTVPPGLYLTEVTQKGAQIQFKGVAQSSTRVSDFMRNIDHSHWLANAELEVIQAGKGSPGSTFTLDAKVVSPKAGKKPRHGTGAARGGHGA
ncbi:MAG: PilN domain-containing protein [Pseudomonadota bacterium]|jgi:type IV pilus assembly protein PilN|nr:PilN domain-containing protein [Pseudomonadota bacterium]